MRQNYPLHIFLFLLSVITTLMAGAELATGHSFITKELSIPDLKYGIVYSVAFLSFLTVHEFGHYFAAMYHKVKCSLPYYLPVFIPFSFFNIGSFGALIRIREMPASRKKYFDIGVAGPLAGFVVSLLILIIGFSTLPNAEAHILQIHPDYAEKFGGLPNEQQALENGGIVLKFGGSILFNLFQNYWPVAEGHMPPSFEMMHYPLIFVGFITLFFTALNLLPIGQLDGGHVVYGLLGAEKAGIVSRIAVLSLLIIGGTGVMHFHPFDPAADGTLIEYLSYEIGTTLIYVYFLFIVFGRMFKNMPFQYVLGMVLGFAGLQALVCLILPELASNPIWLVYAFMTARMVGVDHPVALDDSPLSKRQVALGILAILIFILCFSAEPLIIGLK